MAMNCTGVLYFPVTISMLEGVATELIEARFGLKGVAAFIKLLGKIYKEEGYYLVWNKEQCMLFAHKLGNELSDEEMQEIVELLIAKDIFDRKMYEEHQVLTSVHIQKVWLEATKRRKRDLTPLPYFLVETKVPKNGKEENEVQDVLFPPENTCNFGQSKEKESKDKKNTPPLTPQGENGGERTEGSSFEIPGYAYNKKTHNLEGLILELKQLHIVDRDELKAILKLSDYGRLGGYVFKVIGSTRWSTVMAKGKYIIAALRKERTGNG